MACRLAETAGIYIFFDGYFSLSLLKSELKSVSHHNSTYVKLDIHSNKVWFTQSMWHNMIWLFICFVLQHPFLKAKLGIMNRKYRVYDLRSSGSYKNNAVTSSWKSIFHWLPILGFSMKSDEKSEKCDLLNDQIAFALKKPLPCQYISE